MLVATFRIPPELFALEGALSEIDDLSIEAERIAAHSTEWVMPCLWVSTTDRERVTSELRADPTIDQLISSTPFPAKNVAFYHVEWADIVEERVSEIVDKEGSILNAKTNNGLWEVMLRFATREQFDEFREYLAERDADFELVNLHEPNVPRQTPSNLTANQRETLIAAADEGYYQIPRSVTLEELASHLEISPQAASERLRRGTEALVTESLSAGN